MTGHTALSAPAHAIAPFAAASLIAATVAVIDLLAHPLPTEHLRTPTDYAFVAATIPFVFAIVWVASTLHARRNRDRSRLGRLGFGLLLGAALAVSATAVASFITANDNSLGPLYPLGSLASIAAIVLVAIDCYRTRTLPPWAATSLALAWTVGGLVGENGPLGFRGSALLLAAAYLAVGATRPDLRTTLVEQAQLATGP